MEIRVHWYWGWQGEQSNESVSVSASASVIVIVIGYGYEYGENEHDPRRSVGADVSPVFQSAHSSARQLLRGLEGQHLLQGHTPETMVLGEVVYMHVTADMHDAVAIVADTTGAGACPSTLRSAQLQWA